MIKTGVSITTGLMASAAAFGAMADSVDDFMRAEHKHTPSLAAGAAFGLSASFFSVWIATHAALDQLDKCISNRSCNAVTEQPQATSPNEETSVLMEPIARNIES